MNEIRSYASLSSSLLARKGAAKPAMRPRPLSHGQMLDDLGWDDMGGPIVEEQPTEHVPSSIAALTPAPKAPVISREEPEPVHVQQQTLAEHFSEPDEPQDEQPAIVDQFSDPQPDEQPAFPEAVVTALRRPAQKVRKDKPAPEAGGRKAAFTLRLDGDRHLRLRLASALCGQSSQQLVTAALDQFLETLPEVGTLAQQLPARAGRKS